MEIIGHKRVQEFFAHSIEAGRLGHAYCLVGQAHVGKRTLAASIAARLLNIVPEKLSTHPDYTVIEQLRDDKTDALKRDISIDQIIELRSSLSRQSFFGGYKIAVIIAADRMSGAAANALLKTLEEPKAKTILFLTTTDESHLPQTVLSRCQVLYCARANEAEVVDGLAGLGANKEIAAALAKDAHGLPGLALEWQKNPEIYESYRAEGDKFASLWGKPLYEKIKAVESLFGDKTDTVSTKEHLSEVMSVWELAVRDRCVIASSVEQRQLLRTADAIQTVKNLLPKNIHPRLLVEQVLLTLP